MTSDEKIAQSIYWVKKMQQKEAEGTTFPIVEEANEDVEMSYRSGGKEIENEGVVSLVLKFANIEDMLTLRDDLFPKAGIRARDALDDNVYFNRQFIAQMNVPEEVRVTRHETKEG